MKALITMVFLVFTLFAIPVQGDNYLTEAEKELLLENSRVAVENSSALRLRYEKENAQNVNERNEHTNITKLQSRPVKSRPTASVADNAGTQTQILQSKFRNTSRSYAIYGDSPVKQSRQVSKTAPDYQSFKQSRQVSKPASKNINWAGFFQNLSLIAGAINSGMNQTNSQPFYQQQLTQIQQNNNALMQYNNQQINSWNQNSFKNNNNVNRVYSHEECLGPVVNGQCLGVISPKPPPNTYCYGTVVNDNCLGTVNKH